MADYLSHHKDGSEPKKATDKNHIRFEDLTRNDETQSGDERTVKNDFPRLAFTLHEAAQILGVSYITAFRLVQRGLLKSSTALRTKLIPKSELERFLKSTLQ